MRDICFRGLVFAFLLSGAFSMAAWADVPDQDIPGSQDSPLVTRFPGAIIIGYHTSDFDLAVFPRGKFDGRANEFTKTKKLSGKITDIAYAIPEGKSAFAVYHNYLMALKEGGFKILYQCANEACGDKYEASIAIAGDLRETMTTGFDLIYNNSMVSLLSCISCKLHILTAHLDRKKGDVDVSLMVVGNPGKRVGVLIQTVEGKPMKTGLVKVDPEALSQALSRHGHVAVPGIHFAYNSAKLTEDSDKSLQAMTTVLKSHPELKVFIVGHTDSTGSIAHNLELSKHRAQAVVQALVDRGIDPSRLLAEGVAAFAPVAGNDTEQGRAENRRVEMVKR